jgi:hypothetical protein
MGLFTPAQARAELAGLRPVLEELIVVRADMVELSAALAVGGTPTELGGLPEQKAAEARLNELMTAVQETGAELKGVAPLLVDFPADLDGVPVLLCWLEGEPALARSRLRRPPPAPLNPPAGRRTATRQESAGS